MRENEPLHYDPLDSEHIGELLERNLEPVDALPTPFPTWNRACIEFGGGKGLGQGYYVVLGGATGRLKTTLALNVAAKAVRQGTSVGLVNYEMSQKQSAQRFLTIMSGASTREVQAGPGYDHDKALQIARKVDEQATDGARVYANREPVFTLSDLEVSVRRLVERKNVGLIVVDYLQLIDVEGFAGYEATKKTSNVVRECVHTHGIRGLALAQIGTEAGRKNSRPNRYNLYGGGKWAHDANQIVLVNHAEWYERPDNKIETQVIIDKNRHGPEGQFDVLFDPESMQINEYTNEPDTPVRFSDEDDDEDWEDPFA